MLRPHTLDRKSPGKICYSLGKRHIWGGQFDSFNYMLLVAITTIKHVLNARHMGTQSISSVLMGAFCDEKQPLLNACGVPPSSGLKTAAQEDLSPLTHAPRANTGPRGAPGKHPRCPRLHAMAFLSISQLLYSVCLLPAWTHKLHLSPHPPAPHSPSFMHYFWVAPKELLNRVLFSCSSLRSHIRQYRGKKTKKKLCH